MKKEIIYTEQQQNFISKLEEAEKHYDASCSEFEELYSYTKNLPSKFIWAERVQNHIQRLYNNLNFLFGYVDTKILAKEIYNYFDLINGSYEGRNGFGNFREKFNNLNYYQRLVFAHGIAKKFKYVGSIENVWGPVFDLTYEILSRSNVLVLYKIESYINDLMFFNYNNEHDFEKLFKIEITRFYFSEGEVLNEYFRYLDEFSPYEAPGSIEKAHKDIQFLEWFIEKHKTKEIEDILRNKELFIEGAKRFIVLDKAKKESR